MQYCNRVVTALRLRGKGERKLNAANVAQVYEPAVTYCPEKTNPESLIFILAESVREFGAVWINTTGKEYHMDHTKQPCTANKRGVRW